MGDLKQAEEPKCERNWNEAERWRVIQNTISWVDSQSTGGRNTRKRCLEEQAKLLDRLEKDSE